eukprot:gnl/MRDRNA2_/MRDRNA2_75603_c0_seq2.p1 gnl/MRDRNA2_/MRDRNA2_75603_c0~~gnl/MRDRNA2_/MRDRNA2_75603_c0_seq2.p1  ORF type:complete len:260 (-),score=48.54 gnl/MRDRNA2_/MRDRNA2_75603_c0_seq2:34-813(-)
MILKPWKITDLVFASFAIFLACICNLGFSSRESGKLDRGFIVPGNSKTLRTKPGVHDNAGAAMASVQSKSDKRESPADLVSPAPRDHGSICLECDENLQSGVDLLEKPPLVNVSAALWHASQPVVRASDGRGSMTAPTTTGGPETLVSDAADLEIANAFDDYPGHLLDGFHFDSRIRWLRDTFFQNCTMAAFLEDTLELFQIEEVDDDPPSVGGAYRRKKKKHLGHKADWIWTLCLMGGGVLFMCCLLGAHRMGYLTNE